jgi:hypothetical protein
MLCVERQPARAPITNALLTWTEAAAVFTYGVLTTTNFRLPFAQWSVLTNTAMTSVPIKLADRQRFFAVRWTNMITREYGMILR